MSHYYYAFFDRFSLKSSGTITKKQRCPIINSGTNAILPLCPTTASLIKDYICVKNSGTTGKN
ncbi:MAG: hypothetical protein MJ059_08465, partial [Lachnospiraceae bacterium]|nr:hypothetical protein [Lachnospiraceae bacterium]